MEWWEIHGDSSSLIRTCNCIYIWKIEFLIKDLYSSFIKSIIKESYRNKYNIFVAVIFSRWNNNINRNSKYHLSEVGKYVSLLLIPDIKLFAVVGIAGGGVSLCLCGYFKTWHLARGFSNEPQHEKTYLLTCLSVEDSNQRSLIKIFVILLPPWLSKMRPARILIRLYKCAGWSESLLSAHPG